MDDNEDEDYDETESESDIDEAKPLLDSAGGADEAGDVQVKKKISGASRPCLNSRAAVYRYLQKRDTNTDNETDAASCRREPPTPVTGCLCPSFLLRNVDNVCSK